MKMKVRGDSVPKPVLRFKHCLQQEKGESPCMHSNVLGAFLYVAHSSFWYLRSTRSCHSLFRCCCSALQPLKPAGDHRTHSSADAGASSRSDGEGRPCQCKYRIRKKLELTHGGIMSHSA